MADELSIETIMQLAQQLQGAQAPPVDTRAPDNELGLLGRMLGSAGPNAGLSTAQQEMQARRALMAWGTQVTDAATRYQPYGERSFMGAIGEGNRAAWDTSSQYEQLARTQAKEDREERRQQFSDRISALDAAGKIGKMQQELKLLALRGKGLDVGQGDTGTATGGGTGGGTSGPKFTGDLEKDRKIIIAQESGGDPKAMNYVAKADPSAWDRGATATGKYQFVTGTWKEGLKLAGYDPNQYARAMDAPEEVQDRVFEAIYKQRGSAPWDSSKWAKNWQRGPDGKYTLQATTSTAGTPSRVAARTGGTDVAGPPGTVPIRTPTPPPPGVPAAPQGQLATADNLDAGKAQAASSGQPVAIPSVGLYALPNGNVTSVRPGGTFGEGNATAERGAPAGQSPPGSPPGTPPIGTPPPGAPVAEAPKEPDDTIGLPPGVPGYRSFRAANLRQPTPEERKAFGGELTPEDKASVAEERQQLERALKNANTAFQQGTGESSAVVTAQQKLAEHLEKVRKAGAEAGEKGREAERKFWENQETQLRQAHKELISGAETRLTADNAVENGRKTKALEGLDADVKQAGERTASFDALRTLSRQIDGGKAISAINVNGTPLVDILAAGKWGSPETLRTYGVIQAYRQMASLAVKEVREGMSMGSMSDRDLTFIENMIPRLSQDTFTRELGISLLEAAQRRKKDIALRAADYIAVDKMSPAKAYAKAQEEAPRIIANVPDKFDVDADKITPAQKEERKQWFRDNVRPGQAFRTPDGRIDIYFGDQPKPPGFKHLWELQEPK